MMAERKKIKIKSYINIHTQRHTHTQGRWRAGGKNSFPRTEYALRDLAWLENVILATMRAIDRETGTDRRTDTKTHARFAKECKKSVSLTTTTKNKPPFFHKKL